MFSAFLISDSAGQEKKEIYTDYAVFRADPNRSYVDIYFAFERQKIQHFQSNIDNFLVARYSAKLEVFRSDTLAFTTHWNTADRIKSENQLKSGQVISDLRRLLLVPAKFHVVLTVTDLSNRHEMKNEFVIEARSFQQNSLSVSDLTLALKIEKASKVSKFTKNGFDVLPNPMAVYNLNWPVLYFYCEVYHLSADVRENEKEIYTTIASIYDHQGKLVKRISEKNNPINNPDIVEINKTLVSSLHSGAYQLSVRIENHSTGETAERRKDFFIYREADFVVGDAASPEMEDELRSFYMAKTEEQLDAEFERIAYIATADEKNMYENLDLGGKREFFSNFWQLKSSVEGKDKIRFRRDFFQLVERADELYSTSGKEGWRTDRGRITIKYGIPDDIEKFYSGSKSKPYEVWTYHQIEGGVIFVFLDVTGYGNYKLVHSTAREEIYDENWQTRHGN